MDRLSHAAMTIQRTSAWARMRDRWYRDAARSEIREIAGWLPGLLGAVAFVAIVGALEEPDAPFAWGNYVVGAAAAALAIGLLRGAEWARGAGGWLALSMAVLGLLALVRGLVVEGVFENPGEWISYALVDVAWWGIALQLLARESAQKLARARDVLADGAPDSVSRR